MENKKNYQINEDLQVETLGNYLENKSIALCVTGGIASIEAPKLARHLRRYGANVNVYATKSAFDFVGESALSWGSANDVISDLSGNAEHICLEDLVIVSPATLNTINKVFTGIADNPVTTLIASALGKKTPIHIAPTMHYSLAKNPFLKNNLDQAKDYGIKILQPRISENKLKFPNISYIVDEASRELSRDFLKGKKILVTSGATPTRIDDVRSITNNFSGLTGVLIAHELHRRGAEVKLLTGKSSISTPDHLNVERFRDYDEYKDSVMRNLSERYDIGIFSAAVADYQPENKLDGKTPSGGSLKRIKLTPTEKIIDIVKEKFPDLYMVTFKYALGSTKEELLDISKDRLQKYDMIVANRGEDMLESHKAYILDKDNIYNPQNKNEIATQLADVLGESFERRQFVYAMVGKNGK